MEMQADVALALETLEALYFFTQGEGRVRGPSGQDPRDLQLSPSVGLPEAHG
jgi:hypothetical protein